MGFRAIDTPSDHRYTVREVINMTFERILREKNLTKYQLSKESGIPWATLSDIFSGKADMRRCNAGTLMKLSKALGLSMEELLDIEIASTSTNGDGKPQNKAYLEIDLPESVQKAIDDYVQGERENSPLLDCLWGELYGAINANMWGNRITAEQADHLRSKYLFDDREEDDD